ncbi:hypothetical protein AB0I77_25185 [Streptomyces sp. NPDC050619]|uniref:hypothetical protein n=1 Tax=Streptomyces sp. NPDC050619 TaxID=3157214 RepID=UPI00341ECB79
MTPWLRATGMLVVVGAGVIVSPYGAEWSYGAQSAPPHGSLRVSAVRVSASPSPSASAAAPSRAGSRAGEGRERPGRRVEPDAVPEGEDVVEGDGDGDSDAGITAVPESPRATPGVPSEQPSARAERPAGSGLRILPLGSGLILVGLGLGLAFIALRVRRGPS